MSRIRRWLLAVLVLGLIGSVVELVLTEHYEDTWQMVPIGLIVLAVGSLLWYASRPVAVPTLFVRGSMVLLLAAGLTGIGFHMNGAAEFQREIDPEVGGLTLLTKVMRAKAPPALAPGLLVQLGLIGLIVTFMQEKRP